ncbi:hypothetical protein BKI52_23575 [marine bacterium AO1-C]|nr:hypothetical protein BKI52_23575 [marine bacterium AO1-C]
MKRFHLFFLLLLCFAFNSVVGQGIPNPPIPPQYASELVSHTVPGSMLPGQTVRVQIRMRNKGLLKWTFSGTAYSFRLGAGDGVFNQGGTTRNDFLWSNFRYGGHMTAGQTHYGRAFMGHDASFGQIHTFEFDITAPSNPGTRYVSARMVHELERWFGVYVRIPVTVVSPLNATLTIVSAPSTLFSGQPGRVTVRARNTGTQTWNHTGSNPVRLATTSSNRFLLSNFSFGGTATNNTNARANMNRSVPPGGTIDFSFDITGFTLNTRSLRLSLRMLKGAGTWFGQTANRNITVRGDDIDIPSRVAIGPVPAVNELKVSLDKGSFTKGSQLTLRNMAGRVVKSVKVSEATEQQKLDTSNLKPGIYFLTVQNGKEVITKRIKVQ